MDRAADSGGRVGPYRLVERLGGGADTEVWLAVGSVGRVALKRLRAGWDPLAAMRLAREAMALGRLRTSGSVGVTRVVDLGEDPHDPWMAVELVEGGSLQARLDAGSLDVATVLGSLAGLGSTLEVVHAAAIVHRDVKPSNVLVGSDGPVLADFGAAAVSGTTFDGRIRGSAAVVGTPGFQAPEAGTSAPDPSLDRFALAVTASRLRGAVAEDLDDLARTDPVVADALAELDAWIGAGQRSDPAARPAPGELAACCRRLLDHLGLAWGPPPPPSGRRGSDAHDVVAPVDTLHGREDRVTPTGPAALDRLRSDAVRAGELRVAVVLAEAGAGKTHLLDEALARSRAAGWATARAECEGPDTGPEVLRGWIATLAASVDPDRLGDARVAAALAWASGRDAGRVGRGIGDDAVELADAVRVVLAAAGPCVVALDDIHDASPELVAVLDELAAGGPASLVLAAGRPGTWTADDLGATAIVPAVLDDRALTALAQRELGRPATAEERSLVRSASAGHPLRARLAAGALARGLDVGSGDVSELVRRRVAGWSEADRAAVELAAACGRRFWPEALGSSVTSVTARLLEEGLVEARIRSVVPSSSEVGFAHDLVQRALVGSASGEADRRAVVAARLAQAAAPPTIVAGHAAAAVDGGHLELGGVAASASIAAAGTELVGWSRRTAERHVATARRVLAVVGSDRVTPDELVELDLVDAEVHRRRGDPLGAVRLAEPYAAGSAMARDEQRAEACRVCLAAELDRGAAVAAVEWGRRLSGPLSGARPADRVDLAAALVRAGEPGEALALADGVVGEGGPLDPLLVAEAATIGALAASELAFATSAPPLDAHRRALAAWSRLRDADPRSWVRRAPELVDAVFVTDWDLARRLAAEAEAVAAELGDDASWSALACFLADFAIEAEDPDEAEHWLDSIAGAGVSGRWADRAEVLRLVLAAAKHPGSAEDVVPDLLRLADASAARDPELAHLARIDAAAVLAWEGRPGAARALPLGAAQRSPLDPALLLLDGPPWSEPPPSVPWSVARLDGGLLRALRGAHDVAHRLVVAAIGARREVGLSFPGRLTVVSPALLALALGEPGSDPACTWARRTVADPVLPGLWAVHRAIVAAAVARRDGDAAAVRAALDRVAGLPLEPAVREWIASWSDR